ncbi:MAG: hypothetical protein IT440_07865 [Phycisphaeraceae bacterium]|nr:hypothetical protein [Phycisphaeraceae bacterium]
MSLKRRDLSRLPLLVISLMATMTLTIPLAYFLAPRALRTLRLSQTTSTDVVVRQRALSYVVQHAATDPAVVAAVLAKMPAANDAAFVELMNALDLGGVWRRPPVTDDLWLRWLDLLAGDKDRLSRISAMQLAADAPALAQRLAGLIQRGSGDPDADVRYNALYAAVTLRMDRVVRQAMNDREPAIAADAWLLAGLMGISGGQVEVGDLHAASPVVARAMLWTMATTSRDRKGADGPGESGVVESAEDPSVHGWSAPSQSRLVPALRDFAAWLSPDAVKLEAIPPGHTLWLWRTMLATTDEPALRRWAVRHAADKHDPTVRALLAVIAYRLGDALTAEVPRSPKPLPDDQTRDADQVLDQVLRLAAMESSQAGVSPAAIGPDDSDLLRVMSAVSGGADLVPRVRPVFHSPASTMRDLACAITAKAATPEQADALIAELLSDHDANARMCGAVLAAWTGRQMDLLRSRDRLENDWVVKQIVSLALGDRSDWTGLLARDDVPRTTVLMLALGQPDKLPGALDSLLCPWVQQVAFDARTINPRATTQQPVDLRQVLIEGRWWHVLRMRLPAGHPGVDPWADEELQRFQVELLRLWWLVERGKDGTRRGAS